MTTRDRCTRRFVRAKAVCLAALFLADPWPSCEAAVPEPNAAKQEAAARDKRIGPWDVEQLRQAPTFEWIEREQPIRSLLYAGEPMNGKPTKVFAYFASPETLSGRPRTEGTRYPGVVLIHGGGGTAFRMWVELWAKRGYAAIAMDLAGSRPDDADPKRRTRLPDGGPDQNDAAKFDSIRTEDTSDDWPYHAVASSIRAHSLLRSLPEVDADRTAVTGISWGGYLTCLVASVDDRFRAAVPVYGCGFLHENSVWLPQFAKLGPDLTKRWVGLYDPSSHLPRCRVPMFFVNGTNDFAYPLDSYAKTVRATGSSVPDAPPPIVRIEVAMKHSHEAGWAPAEIGLFVDGVLGTGSAKPLGRCEPAVDEAGRVSARYRSPVPIRTAQLHYALPGAPVNRREWKSLPAKIEPDRVSVETLPAAADLFFFSLVDERGAMLGSTVAVREAVSAFDAPFGIETQARLSTGIAALIRAGKFDEAERGLRQALDDRRLDRSGVLYDLACVQARAGRPDEALGTLERAVSDGWSRAEHMQADADLEPLRTSPRFAGLVAAAKRNRTSEPPAADPQPVAVKDGVALVDEANVRWRPADRVFDVPVGFPAPDPTVAVTTLPGPAGDLLRTWSKEGTAAGLHGFLYDNHDRDHSNMDYGRFPQLARVEFSEAARRRNIDYGFQQLLQFGAPTIGNSSTAHVSGPFWGSQTRVALRRAATAEALARQYERNHLYFYPEHRDHDADGHGDVFHANVPYVVTSQGSSGSDRAFLHAAAATLAAFRPETQRALVEQRLVVPVVQMILRRSRKGIDTDEDYLSGKAHPVVFDSGTLDVERMVRMAHDLLPEQIPPVVRLKVVEEDAAVPCIDYFEATDAGPAEKLFDTPGAIARVARSSKFRRRLVASAAETRDPAGRPLRFRWRLLQGDPARVTIRPLDEQGHSAELLVDWHERRPTRPDGLLLSTRVDVGVFAFDGTRYSAPAFVCWSFPGNERRTYDAQQRIASIEFLPPTDPATYVDPALVTPARWRDDYRYDDGRLVGWTRTRGTATEDFARDGSLATKKDELGRPLEARRVRYVRSAKDRNAWPELVQEPTDETVAIRYASPTDRLGEIVRP